MHPIQDLFLEGFSYVLQIDMHFICTPMWTKFYSCKKWVLHGDSKVIVLNDSDEEEEVHDEITADADAVPSSAKGISASTASSVDTNGAPKGVQGHNSDNQAPDQEADGGSNSGDKAGLP
jgi:hypothetical protein